MEHESPDACQPVRARGRSIDCSRSRSHGHAAMGAAHRAHNPRDLHAPDRCRYYGCSCLGGAVTLIVSIATQHYLVQVGDTRLTVPTTDGQVRIVDDHQNKLTYFDGRAAFGYTGLAR